MPRSAAARRALGAARAIVLITHTPWVRGRSTRSAFLVHARRAPDLRRMLLRRSFADPDAPCGPPAVRTARRPPAVGPRVRPFPSRSVDELVRRPAPSRRPSLTWRSRSISDRGQACCTAAQFRWRSCWRWYCSSSPPFSSTIRSSSRPLTILRCCSPPAPHVPFPNLWRLRWIIAPGVPSFTLGIWAVFYPGTRQAEAGPTPRQWVVSVSAWPLKARDLSLTAGPASSLATTTRSRKFAFALTPPRRCPNRAGFVITLAFRLVPCVVSIRR